MSGVNKVIVIGNLGKDPEVKNLESGKTVASFPVAANEPYKDQSGNKVDNTEWFNCVIWGKLAEIAGKYLKKGYQVYLEGKQQTRSWQNDAGETKYRTEMLVHTMKMLGGKPAEDDLPFL